MSYIYQFDSSDYEIDFDEYGDCIHDGRDGFTRCADDLEDLYLKSENFNLEFVAWVNSESSDDSKYRCTSEEFLKDCNLTYKEFKELYKNDIETLHILFVENIDSIFSDCAKSYLESLEEDLEDNEDLDNEDSLSL